MQAHRRFSSVVRVSDTTKPSVKPFVFSTTGTWEVNNGQYSFEVKTSGAPQLLPPGYSQSGKIIKVNDQEFAIEYPGGNRDKSRRVR
jgi:hypothetical protein